MNLSSQIKYILDLINNKKIYDAKIAAKKLYTEYPDNFEISKIYSFTLCAVKDYEEALNILIRLHDKWPNDYDILNNLGRSYCEREKFQEAEISLLKAIEVNPIGETSFSNLGLFYLKVKKYQKSVDYFQKYIELKGGLKNTKSTEIQIAYLDSLIAIDNNEQAIKILEEWLTVNFNPILYFYLLNMNPSYVDEKENEKILKFYKEKKYINQMDQKQSLSAIYFALARFHEKKNKSIAENYYLEANNMIATAQRFNLIENQKIIKNIIKNYVKLKSIEGITINKGEGLIFVLGLPRSGTTLIESIFANSENVISAGELLSAQHLFYQFAEDKTEISLNLLENIGDEYLRRINFIRGESTFVIDKLPGNYLFLGIIQKCLPAAKFILTKRDYWDVGVSQFRQFYIQGVPYSSKFFNIAVISANFEYISSYWKVEENLKQSLLEVSYEEIVASEDKMAKKMFDFVGITDEYNSDSRNKFFSRTASRFEVRGKVQKKSRNEIFLTYKDQFLKDFLSQKEYWSNQKI